MRRVRQVPVEGYSGEEGSSGPRGAGDSVHTPVGEGYSHPKRVIQV